MWCGLEDWEVGVGVGGGVWCEVVGYDCLDD